MAKIIEMKSWDECEEEIAKIENAHSGTIVGVWFRGLGSAEWSLDTTLERRQSQHIYPVIDYLRLISSIKPEIETFTGSTWTMPDFHEMSVQTKSYDAFREMLTPAYSYMAHLRHYGFPSPLLDWSLSPYVAAYFAFARPKSEKVAMYVYCEQPKNMKMHGSDSASILALGPRVKTHKRHFRQQSSYTVCAKFDVDNGWKFVPHQEVFKVEETEQDLLWKIVMPASEREKVLRRLDRFNLNEFTLFDSEESLMETIALRVIDFKRK